MKPVNLWPFAFTIKEMVGRVQHFDSVQSLTFHWTIEVVGNEYKYDDPLVPAIIQYGSRAYQ